MPGETRAHRAAQGADALAVHDAHLPPPFEPGGIEERVDELGHLSRRDAVQIEAVLDGDDGCHLVGGRRERWRPLQPRRTEEAAAEPGKADDEEKGGDEPEHAPILSRRKLARAPPPPHLVCYADGLGGHLPHFERHLFVCENERAEGHPRGCCSAKGSREVRARLKRLIHEHGLVGRVRANQAGCLDQCERGITIVVYPEGVWYGGVTLADVDEIFERHVLRGEVVERLRLRDAPDPAG